MFSNNEKYNFLIMPALILAGLFLGWLIFGGNSAAHEEHEHASGKKEAGDEVYTCSMHPQIRQNEPGKCPICGMDLTPISQKGDKDPSPFVYEMSKEAIALANIQTAEVGLASLENEILLSGKVQANEQSLATIPAYFPGRIEQLHVNFTGQEIKKGEKLATIYSPELVTAQKELLEAAKLQHINAALYESAKEKLKLWKITEAQIQNIEDGGSIISNFDVYANRSGIVTKRLIAVGDYVSRGEALFEVSDLSKVWIMLDAYESDLSSINKGSVLQFKVAAVPGKVYEAKVIYIDPFINPETRTASIRAEATNKNGVLKPEMFVNATLRSKSGKEKAISIPKTSVLWTGKRSIVYVKVSDSRTPAFEIREIVLGSSSGNYYLVEQGLEEGEEIVVNGVFSIDAAAQLQGNYSMMNSAPVKIIEIPQEFKIQFTNLLEKYFELTNALVQSDAEKAQGGSKAFWMALSAIDVNLLKKNEQEKWIALQKVFSRENIAIASTNDLQVQRKHLSKLSDKLIEAVELFGVEKDSVYTTYCPMALDNKGAYWLSLFEGVYNPYFGDTMLNCGEIKQVYKKGQKVVNKSNASLAHIH